MIFKANFMEIEFLIIRPFSSEITSLVIDQKIPDLKPDSAVGFSASGKFFYDMY